LYFNIYYNHVLVSHLAFSKQASKIVFIRR